MLILAHKYPFWSSYITTCSIHHYIATKKNIVYPSSFSQSLIDLWKVTIKLLYNVFKFSGFHHRYPFFFKNRIFHDQKFFNFFSQICFEKNFWGKVHKTLIFSGFSGFGLSYFSTKIFRIFFFTFSQNQEDTKNLLKNLFSKNSFLHQKVTKNVFIIKSLRFYEGFTVNYFQIFSVYCFFFAAHGGLRPAPPMRAPIKHLVFYNLQPI